MLLLPESSGLLYSEARLRRENNIFNFVPILASLIIVDSINKLIKELIVDRGIFSTKDPIAFSFDENPLQSVVSHMLRIKAQMNSR